MCLIFTSSNDGEGCEACQAFEVGNEAGQKAVLFKSHYTDILQGRTLSRQMGPDVVENFIPVMIIGSVQVRLVLFTDEPLHQTKDVKVEFLQLAVEEGFDQAHSLLHAQWNNLALFGHQGQVFQERDFQEVCYNPFYF